MAPKAQHHLIGGEQDGKIIPAPEDKTPEHRAVYYVVPLADEPTLNVCHGRERAELERKLATLAYKYKESVNKPGVGIEFRYIRTPSMDKKREPVKRTKSSDT